LDNSFEGMSIDEDDEGITPFDSVSNFGLPDQMGDAMEVSFGTPARKRDFLNTSFQSDVKSVISTAAKTTVKVNNFSKYSLFGHTYFRLLQMFGDGYFLC
jgi:hypothetical protein